MSWDQQCLSQYSVIGLCTVTCSCPTELAKKLNPGLCKANRTKGVTSASVNQQFVANKPIKENYICIVILQVVLRLLWSSMNAHKAFSFLSFLWSSNKYVKHCHNATSPLEKFSKLMDNLKQSLCNNLDCIKNFYSMIMTLLKNEETIFDLPMLSSDNTMSNSCWFTPLRPLQLGHLKHRWSLAQCICLTTFFLQHLLSWQTCCACGLLPSDCYWTLFQQGACAWSSAAQWGAIHSWCLSRLPCFNSAKFGTVWYWYVM